MTLSRILRWVRCFLIGHDVRMLYYNFERIEGKSPFRCKRCFRHFHDYDGAFPE